MKPPSLIIADFDEVIARCDIKWISKIRDNHHIFNLKKDDPRFDNLNINLREKYMINEHFEITTLEQVKFFKDLYYNDLNFYDNIPLTEVGSLLSKFSDLPKKFKIVIISVSKGGLSTNIAKSKLKFIKERFNYKNIDIHLVDSDKSTIIAEHYGDWDRLFEDNLNHIESILKITDLEKKPREILVPAYGWNIDNLAINQLIEDKPISLLYYSKYPSINEINDENKANSS